MGLETPIDAERAEEPETERAAIRSRMALVHHGKGEAPTDDLTRRPEGQGP